MAKVTYEDGTVISFDGNPTQADIEEAYNQAKGIKQDSNTEESIPQMLGRNLKNAYNESFGAAAHGLSNMAFGLPKAAVNAMNPEVAKAVFPEQQSIEGKALRGASEAVGYLRGGPAALYKATQGGLKTIPGLVGNTLKQKVARGAVAGGVTGAALTPEQSDTPILAPKERTFQGGLGAVMGGAGEGIAAGVGALSKATKGGADLMQKFRQQFFKVKTDAVSKFGQDVDALAIQNPNKSVSLRQVVDDVNSNWNDTTPEARTALKKIFGEMLDNPELSNDVSLQKTQEIINYANNKLPANIKFKHLDIMDALNDVRASQLDAFPEMAQVRADYRSKIEPFNNVKNYFKFGRLQKAIESGFEGAEQRKAIETLLPEDVIKEMGGYKNARDFIKGAKWLGREAIRYGIPIGGGLYFGMQKLGGRD